MTIQEGSRTVFDKRITLGNILQILVIGFGIISAYYNVDNRVNKLEVRIGYIEKDTNRRLDSIEEKLDRLLSTRSTKR